MEVISIEKCVFELIQREWDNMDVIGIFHSQQTQKDVRKTMDVVDLCFNNFVDG